VAHLGFFLEGLTGNPMRTEGVWAYGRILCICELGRWHNWQCIHCFNEWIISWKGSVKI